MKRVMCETCEGEGEFDIRVGVMSVIVGRVDCEDCRGLGWIDPPLEEDEDDHNSS